MVCLVAKKLHDTERFWLLNPGRTISGIPDKHPIYVRVVQSRGPLFDFLIPLQTKRLEVDPIRRTCEGMFDGFLWASIPFYSFQYQSISPIKMVQCRCDRLEESTSILPAILVGEPIGGRYQ